VTQTAQRRAIKAHLGQCLRQSVDAVMVLNTPGLKRVDLKRMSRLEHNNDMSVKDFWQKHDLRP
jgi:hypothetical protein